MILLQCNTPFGGLIGPTAVFYVKETRTSAVYCTRHKMCAYSYDALVGFLIFYFETFATLDFKTAQHKNESYNVSRNST